MFVKLTNPLLAITAAITLAASGPAFADSLHKKSQGDDHAEGHRHADSSTIGQAGKQSAVSRTVEIIMGDNYFEPEMLTVRMGETIRFVVRNEGDFLHEFNVGAAANHVEHQEEMMAMMEQGVLTATGVDHGMMKMDHGTAVGSAHAHDDPNSILVEPGKTQVLVWQFTAATDLQFACNVPGHYEAGMMGEITIGARPQTAKGN